MTATAHEPTTPEADPGAGAAARTATIARRAVRAARTPVASTRAVAGRLARLPLSTRRVLALQRENAELRAEKGAWVPAGHFYSPFPDLAEYGRRVGGLLDPVASWWASSCTSTSSWRWPTPWSPSWRRPRATAPVRARAPAAAPASTWSSAEDDRGDRRYWLDNFAYAYGDGVVLHAMLRHLRPSRIVEVGSGFSSALILDTVDGWLPGTEVSFVEPYPALVEGLLRPGDEGRVAIHRQPVQDVDPAVFDALGPGDVLFVDSTHVVKAGSDVNHLFFEVLPRLRPGVWVHLHDIFFPFEYPEAWVREGRAWHEAYLLRAFLTFNEAFAVRWFQTYLWARHQATVARLPWIDRNPGGNIWLDGWPDGGRSPGPAARVSPGPGSPR